MTRPLTTQNRRPFPREHVAVAAFVLFGLILIAAITLIYIFSRARMFRSLPTHVAVLLVACVRLVIASLEFGIPPSSSSQRGRAESAMAILDAISLVPLLLVPITMPRYMDFITGKLSNNTRPSPKESGKTSSLIAILKRNWKPVTVGMLSLIGASFIVTGSGVAFSNSAPDTAAIGVLCAGVFLDVVIAWGLCFTAWHRFFTTDRKMVDDLVPWYLPIMASTPFLIVRLVWAVGSAFSVQLPGALFSPFRNTDKSTWANLGMVVVMEFLVSTVCLFMGLGQVGWSVVRNQH
ncbi:hypothetical protein B0H66DRAFT_563217 [Apodospora peruviana]|uniref:DUF7702 domain-containing protein n=1 Tax=Apodospora peruviana TaxID=516989 RepID=A0AAE0HXH0_9PEZI|nr:hypothetical protein B0H66DRAFT_563217 [Apodospora peruviana]